MDSDSLYRVDARFFLHLLAIRKIFPGGSAAKAPVLTDTPLALMMAQLDAEQQAVQSQGDQQEQAGGQQEPVG